MIKLPLKRKINKEIEDEIYNMYKNIEYMKYALQEEKRKYEEMEKHYKKIIEELNLEIEKQKSINNNNK